ncbi:hypothetical protein AB9P05_06020 [Roseivirga sp. BDSF3-8]|uniref:hypothetical protein n=1 Tax=Roseivirga sp. BDSF3-8 TaxID=3241598 RepID=UPI003531E72B
MGKILGVLCCFSLLYAHTGNAQNQRVQFTVDNGNHYEDINLQLKSTTGRCEIVPSANYSPVYVISKSTAPSLNPTFVSEVRRQTNFVSVSLEEAPIDGLGRNLRKIFGSEEDDIHWKVYLSKHKPFNLNLQYVMGDADIDLTGLPIRNLAVNTGSADVQISYNEGSENTVDMDTFYAKVDMGSLRVNRFNLSRAREVTADVGFGSLYLDMSDEIENQCTVTASVGAGSMEVSLPAEEVPTIVYINNSALCKVKMCKSFKLLRENVYVNQAYSEEADNLLTFDIDVAMGSIRFTSNEEE